MKQLTISSYAYSHIFYAQIASRSTNVIYSNGEIYTKQSLPSGKVQREGFSQWRPWCSGTGSGWSELLPGVVPFRVTLATQI